MSIIIPANSAVGGGFDVDNSLRFYSDTYLTNTFGSAPTLATKNTFSIWFKRSILGTQQQLMSANNNAAGFVINSNDTIAFYNNSGPTSGQLLGPRLYRDTSAWMHFVFVYDSTQGTAANRLKAYINGVLETSFNNTGYPNQNVASAMGENGTNMKIAARNQNDRIFEGYVAETAFVDGQALAADSFGEFDEDSGIWKPIDISGLTFGNNGFYLEYKQSGTGTNASGMGADTSGNNFNFAVTNLTAIDQSTDTCTNNFATMNPLDNYYAQATFSEGNLKVATASSPTTYVTSTIGVTPNFKCYWEAKFDTTQSGNGEIGMVDKVTTGASAGGGASRLYYQRNGISVNDSGQVWGNNSNTGQSLGSLSTSDIICFAWDGTNNALYIRKNGDAWVNSGNPASGSSKTGAFVTPDSNITIFQAMGDQAGNTNSTASINLGSPPYSISSGNQDGNGYGNFEYAVPSGYFSINTKNLAEYG